MWECALCTCENGELADSCSDCGTVHVVAPCCNERRPERRMHVVTLGEPEACSECMSVEDYHARIDRIANIYESRRWLDKHTDEIQERDQAFIELVCNRFYDHHMALQDVKAAGERDG